MEIDYTPQTTVKDLKDEIVGKGGNIPEDGIKIHDDTTDKDVDVKDDSQTLRDAGIKGGDTITVDSKEHGSGGTLPSGSEESDKSITVKIPDGKKIEMDYTPE